METRSHDRRKKRCCGVPLFVFNVSAILLLSMMGSVYTGGVVRTLERRFSLSSSQTGFLFSCNDIVSIILVIFVGYFGRRAHKPRIISFTMLFTSLAYMMMAIPHWVFNSSASSAVTSNSSASGFSTKYCSTSNSSTSNCYGCDVTKASNFDADSYDGSTTHPAYNVFIAAQLTSGIGIAGLQALSLAYIDENASKSKSSFYIGIFSSMYALGPLFGFSLAAFTLRLPENLMSATTDKPGDPTFIGCWWLGYVICSVGVFLLAVPLWFYPKSFKVSDEDSDRSLNSSAVSQNGQSVDGKRPSSGIRAQIKEFPRNFMRLLRNTALLVNIGCNLCQAYFIMGVYANLVRYVEIHFNEPAFVGSIIAGLVSAFAAAIGGFAGGALMSRMKLTPPQGVRIMIMSAAIFSSGLLVILFLRCPQIPFAAEVDPAHGTLSVLNECNLNCTCPTDRTSFSPVCGSDNLTYFSACFAGCTGSVNGTYTGCSCLGASSASLLETAAESTWASYFSGTAQPGNCITGCKMLIPFAAVSFVMSLFGSMAVVPSTIVNLRVVKEDERSFALSLVSFFISLVGFIPAPLIFGRLVDSSCIMWQRFAAVSSKFPSWKGNSTDTAYGETGNCLLYDVTKLRHRIYGPVLGIKLSDMIMSIVLYLLIRNRKFDVGDEDNADSRPSSGISDTNGSSNCADVENRQLLSRNQQQ